MKTILLGFLFYFVMAFTSIAQALEVDSSQVTLPSTIGLTSETWVQISFGTTFSNIPIVITTPGPSSGGNPFTIRIRNVTTTGFEAQTVEPNGPHDPRHYAVEMTYIAIEEGTHGLPDGSMIIAGRSNVDEEQMYGVVGTWYSEVFPVLFDDPPTILAQIQTINNEIGLMPINASEPWMTVAIDNSTTSGFDMALERSEVTVGTIFTSEEIGWVAITPNVNGSLVDVNGNDVLWESLLISPSQNGIGKADGCETELLNAPFISTTPAVVATNSRIDDDGGWGAVCSLTATTIGYCIDEDWYGDTERNHTGEYIGILLFESGVIDIDLDADDDGLDDTVEIALGLDPNDPDSDDDTVGDADDLCYDFDDLLDTDGDGTPDCLDTCPHDSDNDIDGDGVCGDIDPCPLDNPDDSDSDSICDSNDVCPGFNDLADADNDSVPDGCDTCPNDNPDDIDGDGICSSQDVCPNDALNDDDNDGVCYGLDNCPNTENSNQADVDEDSIGDVCDNEDNRKLVGGWGCSTTKNNSLPLLSVMFAVMMTGIRRRKGWLFLLMAPFLMAVSPDDAQTYKMPLGDVFSTIDAPLIDSKYSLKLGGGYALDPLFYKSDSGEMEPIVDNLYHVDLRYQQRFGNPKASFNISGDATYELNGVNNGLKRPRLSAGMSSISKSGVGGIISGGSTFNQTKEFDANVTLGLFKDKFGIAASGGAENISSDIEFRAKAGVYLGGDTIRTSLEWNQKYGEYKPAEALLGLRIAKGRFVIQPAIGVGINNQPATPKIRGLLTVSFKQPKKIKNENLVQVDEEKTEEDSNKEDEEGEEEETEEIVIEPSNDNNDEKVILQEDTTPVEDGGETLSQHSETKKENNSKDSIVSTKQQNVKQTKQKERNTYKGIKSKSSDNIKSEEKSGENKMPNPPQSDQTSAHELQPSTAITPESMGQLSAGNSADPTLTLLLAILAVVGGGAAWKFYTQYSEQKHDQKMKQMEINAKAQGLSGAQPPPCQAANVKLEAEIKEIKARLGKVDQKMSLNADFDGDLLTRKFKKLERRVKDLEGDEE